MTLERIFKLKSGLLPEKHHEMINSVKDSQKQRNEVDFLVTLVEKASTQNFTMKEGLVCLIIYRMKAKVKRTWRGEQYVNFKVISVVN